jgi:formate/nitrite transporter FocA (FNT family)
MKKEKNDRTGKDPSADNVREAEAVEDRATPPTPVIYEVVRHHGEEEMERPGTSLWWSGVAAGLSISFSLLAQAIIKLRTPDADWAPLAIAAGYPVGFLMVVLGRQQLFTENTITMVLPVMAEPTRAKLASLGRSWSIILAANLAGTLIAALFCSWTPVLSPEVLDAMLGVSRHAMDKAWAVVFFEAITAGFLMAVMVWLLPAASHSPVPVIFLITYLIAISGSAHIVAGSMEAFMLVVNGQMGAWHAFAGFAVPALLGNIVGGTILFALLSHAQVMREI